MLQEIQVREGLKNDPIHRGRCGFFLEQPIIVQSSDPTVTFTIEIISILPGSHYFW